MNKKQRILKMVGRGMTAKDIVKNTRFSKSYIYEVINDGYYSRPFRLYKNEIKAIKVMRK